jgi:hypothetical protein
MKRHIILLTIVCLAFAAPLYAQRASDESVLTYDVIRSERKNLAMESLDITPAQMKELEPIYDAYLAEHDELEEHRLHVVQQYVAKHKGLSDAEAEILLEEMALINRLRFDLYRKYTKKFGKVLPPRLVLRLWQVENKLDTVIDLQYAKEVPLAK